MQTVPTLATTLAAAFVTAERKNGETFYHLADGSPEWMTDAVHAGHDGMMPDDWRYRMIRGVAAEMAEMADPTDSDAMHEHIDTLIPIYNHDRLQWLASRLDRAEYVNEAVNEYGLGDEFDLFAALAYGMESEFREIWYALAKYLKEQAEEQNEEDED